MVNAVAAIVREKRFWPQLTAWLDLDEGPVPLHTSALDALQRHLDHVLRSALVKRAMSNAANVHAKTRNTQPSRVSQAAVTLAESLVRLQSTRATVVPTGRWRSNPTLTC